MSAEPETGLCESCHAPSSRLVTALWFLTPDPEADLMSMEEARSYNFRISQTNIGRFCLRCLPKMRREPHPEMDVTWHDHMDREPRFLSESDLQVIRMHAGTCEPTIFPMEEPYRRIRLIGAYRRRVMIDGVDYRRDFEHDWEMEEYLELWSAYSRRRAAQDVMSARLKDTHAALSPGSNGQLRVLYEDGIFVLRTKRRPPVNLGTPERIRYWMSELPELPEDLPERLSRIA